jgi:hypothetical protein
MAGAHVRERAGSGAEQTFARFLLFRRMLSEFYDLAFSDAANLIQMKAALAFLRFQIHGGTEEGIGDHGQSGKGRASHG